MEAEVAKMKGEHQAAVEAQDASHILSEAKVLRKQSRKQLKRDENSIKMYKIVVVCATYAASPGLKKQQDENEDREAELQGAEEKIRMKRLENEIVSR